MLLKMTGKSAVESSGTATLRTGLIPDKNGSRSLPEASASTSEISTASVYRRTTGLAVLCEQPASDGVFIAPDDAAELCDIVHRNLLTVCKGCK